MTSQLTIKNIINSISINSKRELLWIDSKVKLESKSTTMKDLITILSNVIYGRYYVHGVAIELNKRIVKTHNSNLLFDLSKANNGIGYTDSSWIVRSVNGNKTTIWKDDLNLDVDTNELNNITKTAIKEHHSVSIKLPKESYSLSSDFYHCYGNSYSNQEDEIVRFYFCLDYKNADSIVLFITDRLNQKNIPFEFKILNDSSLYDRIDTSVLYIPYLYYDAVQEVIKSDNSLLDNLTKDKVVPFAKKIRKGVFFAEDPINGKSFGEVRCDLIAEGIIKSLFENKTNKEDIYESILKNIQKHRYNILSFHLNPEPYSHYNYYIHNEIEIKEIKSQSESSDFLNFPYDIAEYLVNDAIWDGTSCNFLVLNDQSRLIAMNPFLYDGTAGVSLFLGEMYSISGNKDYLRTAIGCIDFAINKFNRSKNKEVNNGLFTGLMGILVVAARIDSICNTNNFKFEIKELCKELNPSSIKEFDLLEGKSGILLGILILYKIYDDNFYLQIAEKILFELKRDAILINDCISFKDYRRKTQKHLVGFSHGTSGVAFALLELYSIKKDVKLLRFVDQIFAYEDLYIDTSNCNWYDFRNIPEDNIRHAKSDMVAWCHGAPGIVIPRIHAYTITSDSKYLNNVFPALELTKAYHEYFLKTSENSLCHGLFGNECILRFAKENLKNKSIKFPDYTNLKLDNISFKINKDMLSESEHGLMTGVIGVAYSILFLEFKKELPSILLPKVYEF